MPGLAYARSTVATGWFGEKIWKKIIRKKDDVNKGEIFAPPPFEYPPQPNKPTRTTKKQDSSPK